MFLQIFFYEIKNSPLIEVEIIQLNDLCKNQINDRKYVNFYEWGLNIIDVL